MHRFASRKSICEINSEGRITTVHVDIAAHPTDIMNGLMHQSYMPSDSGMVFLFPQPHSTGFWMKNTLIPLSIAFWDQSFTIIAIMDMEPCEGVDCPSYTPDKPYMGALEVNKGFFSANGIQVGDKVQVFPK